MNLPADLRGRLSEFRRWKESRDPLVQEALKAGMPAERIAEEMGIAKSVVHRIKATQRSRGSAPSS